MGHAERSLRRIMGFMRLEKLAKDLDSGISGCPTVYLG